MALMVGVAAALCTSVFAIGVRSHFQTNRISKRIPSEQVTLYSKGFRPVQITRPSGHFLLALDNRSGVDDIVLRLERLGLNYLKRGRFSRTKLRQREVLDLEAGQYLLLVEGHPEWTCSLTIIGR